VARIAGLTPVKPRRGAEARGAGCTVVHCMVLGGGLEPNTHNCEVIRMCMMIGRDSPSL